MSEHVHCAIVAEHQIEKLMIRYLGGSPALTPTETEILLFALYTESLAAGGLAKRGTDIMDGRLKTQNDRIKNIDGGQP